MSDPAEPGAEPNDADTDEDSPVSATLALPSEAAGQRLDVWLAAHSPDYSRVQIKRMIADGLVRWHKPPRNGAKLKVSYLIQGGEELWVQAPAPRAQAVAGEAIELAMLYEDSDLAAVNKPAGLVVHPGAGVVSGTLANALVGRYGAQTLAGSAPDRPGIVHRLDRETSGVMAIARNEKALRLLMAQFEERTVRKCYLALVHGSPGDEFTVEAAIGRHPTHRMRMAIQSPEQGRGAVTRFRTLARFRGEGKGKKIAQPFALVACFPKTGRTHQLRVHLNSVDCPVLSDAVYGRESRYPADSKQPPWIARQALHAYALAVTHPVSGERLRFVAPLPADMEAVLVNWSAAADSTEAPVDWRAAVASVAAEVDG